MTPEERRIFCRIVGTLLVADLKLHDAEVRYLEELYQRLGVSKTEREAIETTINLNDDVRELAQSLPAETRKYLLEELHKAAWADGVLMRSEAKIIVALEEALG
jgi:uncharacterized tellurite resistance protein B-like protein